MYSLKSLAVLLGTGFIVFALSGCGSAPRETTSHSHDSSDHQHIDKDAQAANFAKLSEADRRLAEVQGYCAVTEEPLGSMGVPIKLTLKDQPVFICCKGCQRKAETDPDKALAKVEQLKTKVESESDHQ